MSEPNGTEGPTGSAVEPPPLAAPERILAVTVAGTEFGLPVEAVREVVRVPTITRLPFPPPTIRGVASVRGEIVAVMDLGERLLGRSSEPERRLVVVIDPRTSEPVGLLVEDVAGLVGETGEHEVPPEAEVSLPSGWIDRLMSPAPGRLVTVLRLAPVLALHEANSEETR